MIQGYICKEEDFNNTDFKTFIEAIQEPYRIHRKLWEYFVIANAAESLGLLKENSMALNIDTRNDPLSLYFANKKCNCVNTEILTSKNQNKISQNISNYINASIQKGICSIDTFYERIKFIPFKLSVPSPIIQKPIFNFIWSTNVLESLGSIANMQIFIMDSLNFLKPGGYAFFTTNYNCTSNDATADKGKILISRKKDFETLSNLLPPRANLYPIDYSQGESPYNYLIDTNPYKQNYHIKLHLCGYTITSIFIIIQKIQ